MNSFVLLSTFRNFVPIMATKRIEYIDAMRGFTMILVVYSHICRYCLGDWTMAWNDVFFLFRLPCFFFISGWLFEQVGRQWNSITIRHTIKHKFMVQIVPTVIFLLLLAPPPLFFSRLGTTKGGYWFTFALFVFFLLYIFFERYSRKWQWMFTLATSASAFFYDVYFNLYFKDMGLLTDVLGFLSFATWRYYLFFYIGTWVKRHFEDYIRWTGNPFVLILVVIGFALIAWQPHTDNSCLAYLVFTVGGILGLTMVFTFFRSFATVFTKDRFLGRSLQYIGTRTLDVYLIHYFVLPRFLLFHKTHFLIYDSRTWEFVVALLLALMVILICLVVSYFIRLSPFLGHYLFGVKYERQQ